MKRSHPLPFTLQACAWLALLAAGLPPREAGAQITLEIRPNGNPGAPAAGAPPAPATKPAVLPAKKADPAPQPAPRAEGPHLLELKDGSQLHGTIEAIDSAKGRLRLRHPAASEALALPIARLSRVSFGDGRRSDVQARATIKFRSGGWVAGAITGLEGDVFQLQLEDGTAFPVARGEVDWIFFSNGPAPECFEGPTGLGGWSSNGVWAYRDAALRQIVYGPIQREFSVLPDLVEYQVEALQSNDTKNFSILLRGMAIGLPATKNPATNQPDPKNPQPDQPRDLKISRSGSKLTLAVATKDGARTDNVDVSAILPEPKPGQPPVPPAPVKLRVLQNYVTGKLVAFLNDRRVVEWTVTPGRPGKNGGTLVLDCTGGPLTDMALSNIKVLPWDGMEPKGGEAPAAAGQSDRIVLQDGQFLEGKLSGVSAGQIRLKNASGEIELSREKISMIRFAQGAPPAPGVTVAQVRLARRGDIEAAGLAWREGKLLLKTRFGAELALSPALLDEVQFSPGAFEAPLVSDTIVFRDGDRLPGILDSTRSNGKVAWRGAAGEPVVDIAPERITSVLLGRRPGRPEGTGPVVARLRNGDWLEGKVVQFDEKGLQFESAQAGSLQISRADLQSLAFGLNGQPAVFDASTEPGLWQRLSSEFRANQAVVTSANGMQIVQNGDQVTVNGVPINVQGGGKLIIQNGQGGEVVIQGGGEAEPAPIAPSMGRDKKKEKDKEPEMEPARTDWAYADGTFSVRPAGSMGRGNFGRVSLNRVFEVLPPRVEIRFDVTLSRVGAICYARLFSEGSSAGYNLTMSAESTTIRDMGQTARKAVIFPDDDKERAFGIGGAGRVSNGYGADTVTKRIQIFADRLNDTVTVFADGVRVASLKPKTPADVRKLGRGVMLVPGNVFAAYSNLWVGPWMGRLPDAPEAAAKKMDRADPKKNPGISKGESEAPVERILLVNGDETEGKIRTATAETLKVESEIGPLTLAANRVSLIDFRGKEPASAAGTRLRLAGGGLLTVRSYAIADGVLTCQSETLGELKMPLAALQEVSFAALPEAAPAGAGQEPANAVPVLKR